MQSILQCPRHIPCPVGGGGQLWDSDTKVAHRLLHDRKFADRELDDQPVRARLPRIPEPSGLPIESQIRTLHFRGGISPLLAHLRQLSVLLARQQVRGGDQLPVPSHVFLPTYRLPALYALWSHILDSADTAGEEEAAEGLEGEEL